MRFHTWANTAFFLEPSGKNNKQATCANHDRDAEAQFAGVGRALWPKGREESFPPLLMPLNGTFYLRFL